MRADLTTSLKRRYLENGFDFISQSVDFLSECKFVLLRTIKAADDGITDVKLNERWEVLKSVILTDFDGPLTPQGFEDVMRAYLAANDTLLEISTLIELSGLLKDVETGELVLGDGGPWVIKL